MHQPKMSSTLPTESTNSWAMTRLRWTMWNAWPRLWTSCSKTLDLGDEFGSLQVVSLTTTEDGEQNLGGEVTYTYTVENLGSETLATVDVVDDKLGVVPGSPITNLGPGATAVLQAQALISEETTNLVAVIR